MSSTRAASVILITFGLLTLYGCNAINPDRPIPWSDVTIYGNLLEVNQSPQDPSVQVLQVRIGMPRALGEAKKSEGRATPTVEKGTIAEVSVHSTSVVMLNGRPAAVDSISPGTELVVLPVSGTTFMVGVSKIVVEANFVLDFTTYRGWQLPGLANVEGHPIEKVVDDPDLINTSGIEHAPVPTAGGRVLYFTSRLRSPSAPGEPWLGARRAGLDNPAEEPMTERTFRSELGADGWQRPELVAFSGAGQAMTVMLTWINEDETECLLTIRDSGDSSPWIGRSTRANRAADWSPVERVEALGDGYTSNGVYLAGSKSQIVFISTGVGLESGDLFLFNPAGEFEVPVPLGPYVNTTGDEWAPRVGPDNELVFCRGNHQLYLSNGQVRPLRLPGANRALISEANPTRDGKWIFFCMPELTPVELDQNIYVAQLNDDWSLEEAVPVDEWRLPDE
jgi:hypothetical protein